MDSEGVATSDALSVIDALVDSCALLLSLTDWVNSVDGVQVSTFEILSTVKLDDVVDNDAESRAETEGVSFAVTDSNSVSENIGRVLDAV